MAAATHNVLAMHVMEGLKDSFHTYFRVKKYTTKPERKDVLLGQHKDIFEAIRQKNPKEARKKIMEHLDYVEKMITEDIIRKRVNATEGQFLQFRAGDWGGNALNRDEVIGGLLIFLFGAVTCYFSLRMPIGTFRAAGSGLFPLGLGNSPHGSVHRLLLKLFVQGRGARRKSSSQVPRSGKQVLPFMGAIALATLFFNELGYPLMSFLLLFALLRILGVKNWAYNVLLSLATATGLTFFLSCGCRSLCQRDGSDSEGTNDVESLQHLADRLWDRC